MTLDRNVTLDTENMPSLIPQEKLHILVQGDTFTFLGGVDPSGRFQLHTHLHNPLNKSNLKKFKEVQAELEEALRQRGFTDYYTVADSAANFHFCKHFGFHSALITYTLTDGRVMEFMRKEI